MLFTEDGSVFLAWVAIGLFVAGVIFLAFGDRLNYIAAPAVMVVFALAVAVILVSQKSSGGKVLEVAAKAVSIEGPNHYEVRVDFDPNKYTLKKGDEVEIAKKGNKWVVVEMTRR